MRHKLFMSIVVCALATVLGCSGKDAPTQAADAEVAAEAAARQAERDSHPDNNDILGTWKIVESEWDGEPNKRALGNIYTFENAMLTAWVREVGGDINLRYEMDPKKNPKHLTAKMGFPPNEHIFTAIYELDGDTLKFCFHERDRPSSFKTERGSMWTSHVLKRMDGSE